MPRLFIGLVCAFLSLSGTQAAFSCNVNCQDFWRKVAEAAEFQQYANQPSDYFTDRIFFEFEEWVRREHGDVTERDLDAAWDEFVERVNRFGHGGQSPFEPVDSGSVASTILGELFTYPVAPSAPYDFGGVGPIGEAFNDGRYGGPPSAGSPSGGGAYSPGGFGHTPMGSSIYNGSTPGYTSGSGSPIYNCDGSCGIGTIYNSPE